MILGMSLYPTDTDLAKKAVCMQAEELGVKLFFVSLHIPEATGLHDFVDWLKTLNIKHGYHFFADISPLTLERLEISIADIGKLQNYGIIGVRIDFGFTIKEISSIAETGLQVALNASTITEADLIEMKVDNLIGWHNYYPRPESGITEQYFLEQNELLRKYNIPIYSFIPGDEFLRAPLFLKLPMLEQQRQKTAYVNFMLQMRKYKVDKIFIAEGIIDQANCDYITKYLKMGQISFPLSRVEPALYESMKDHGWSVRIEQNAISWRLENTRGYNKYIHETTLDRSAKRTRGTIFMDSSMQGRYAGEIHLIHTDASQNDKTICVGVMHKDYFDILDVLQGNPVILFTIIDQ
ncbi:outer surface protein [Erysipelotrichaceae bacterium]|nr:outer surface protein [Erysipelotrichaceae bacterium]